MLREDFSLPAIVYCALRNVTHRSSRPSGPPITFKSGSVPTSH